MTTLRSTVQRAYDTVAADYAENIPDTGAEAPIDLAMVDMFLAKVRHAGGGEILDAGCGAGRMSRYIADRGAAVTGVDLSPGMVAMARRDHPDLTFTVGTLQDLPYRDDTFAGILLWYSTIHATLLEQPPIFADVTRVLRPGGHVLIGFQSGEGDRDVAPAFERMGHRIELVRHLYTADQVSDWMSTAGLEETCRVVRNGEDGGPDGHSFLLARLRSHTSRSRPAAVQ